jgi:quercetin dioxygenase-like cupin family protein
MTRSTPVRTRHIYHFDELDRVPDGPCSATLTPRRLLSGETLETGKTSSVGAVVMGARAQVAQVLKLRGTGSKIHTHSNEQFNDVLQGTLIADMDGQVFRVPKGHVVHIPAGMPHSHAPAAGHCARCDRLGGGQRANFRRQRHESRHEWPTDRRHRRRTGLFAWLWIKKMTLQEFA